MKRIGLLLLLFPLALVANERSTPLLDESEYRTPLEEVVVTGQVPEWRKPEEKQWRPDVFELPEQDQPSRILWFPEYLVDERDTANESNSINDEKATWKIFQWRF